MMTAYNPLYCYETFDRNYGGKLYDAWSLTARGGGRMPFMLAEDTNARNGKTYCAYITAYIGEQR
jgi:hypothetical protein